MKHDYRFVPRLRCASAGLLLCLAAAGVSACGSGDDNGPAKAAASSPAPSSSPSAEASGCSKLVSAIGFANLLLKPRGKEAEQSFEPAVRSRLAYTGGTVTLFTAKLPPELRADAARLERVANKLGRASTPRKKQITLLREYRSISAGLVAKCKGR